MLLSGLLRDWFGSYIPVFYLCGLVGVATAILLLLLVILQKRSNSNVVIIKETTTKEHELINKTRLDEQETTNKHDIVKEQD